MSSASESATTIAPELPHSMSRDVEQGAPQTRAAPVCRNEERVERRGSASARPVDCAAGRRQISGVLQVLGRHRSEALAVEGLVEHVLGARVELEVEGVLLVDAAVVDEHPGAAVLLCPAEQPADERAIGVVVPGRVLADQERQLAVLAVEPVEVLPQRVVGELGIDVGADPIDVLAARASRPRGGCRGRSGSRSSAAPTSSPPLASPAS